MTTPRGGRAAERTERSEAMSKHGPMVEIPLVRAQELRSAEERALALAREVDRLRTALRLIGAQAEIAAGLATDDGEAGR